MIRAITYARREKKPFFGICLGLQCASIEYARNVCGVEDADSTEFDPDTPNPVIFKLRDLLGVESMGGTMRLGAYECELAPGSLAESIYKLNFISERHRHRYEFNPAYKDRMAESGLIFSGQSPDGKFIEMIELEDHPWFVGTQAHPELKSKPLTPHPLFASFIRAAYNHRLRDQVGDEPMKSEVVAAD
jgi:CTP synthase